MGQEKNFDKYPKQLKNLFDVDDNYYIIRTYKTTTQRKIKWHAQH